MLICTPDKDLAQCVADARVVQLDRRNGRVFDEAGVREKFGVAPASIPDWLALVGDSADGFPGLRGWGAKSASAVLARYEHLEAIPEHAIAWDLNVRGATKLAATLVAEHDLATAVPRPRHPADRRARRDGRRLAMAGALARPGGVGGAARRPRDRQARGAPGGAEGRLTQARASSGGL